MTIDPITFAVVSALVAAISGTLLIYAWWQFRESPGALWWAAGLLTLGSGVMALAIGEVKGWQTVGLLGVSLLSTAPSLVWTAARAFERRRLSPALLAAGPLACLVLAFALHGGSVQFISSLLSAMVIATYYMGAGLTFYWGRAEQLQARFPMVGLLVVQAGVVLVTVPVMALERVPNFIPPVLSLPGIIHFETIIFVIASAVLFVTLMKERIELQQRQRAETDVLTRLPNRRAFLSTAERLWERRSVDNQPLAVAAFDLDRFKSINDRFGHAIGDRALQVFADVARDSLRPGDMISRLGGEEFAAVFPGADVEVARLMAERVRRAYAEAGLVVEGREVGATVSVGVAVANGDESLAALMGRADAALYRAKLNGRDRVECDQMDGRATTYPRLVRVA